jgi:hypothetical protein
MSDIVEWLRDASDVEAGGSDVAVMCAAAAEEIERLRAAPKVKPLEWEEYTLEELATTSALSPFGRFFANKIMWWGPGVVVSTGYNCEEQTQAAAQADYERRILSALTQEPHQ